MLDIPTNVMVAFKFILILCGLAFFIYMCGKREKNGKNRWERFYGDFEDYKSVQFIIVAITMVSMFVFLIIDLVLYFFSTSIIQIILVDLSKLSDEIIGILLSSIITVTIGFVGIIGIIVSILYGSLHVHYSKKPYANISERIKVENQGKVWIVFSSYFIAFTIIVFIQPLLSQLGS